MIKCHYAFAYCYIVISVVTGFDNLLPDGGQVTRPPSHVLDLNITVLVRPSSTRIHGSGYVFVDVNVPYVTNQSQSMCPSFYLIDLLNPLEQGGPLTYNAVTDRLGAARSPCAAIDYEYDRATFAAGFMQRYASVTPGWNVILKDGRADYRMPAPLSLEAIVSSCGGEKQSKDRSHRYVFFINVCQVGFYGKRCESDTDMYAAACAVSQVVVIESPITISVAASMVTQGRLFESQSKFVRFETSNWPFSTVCYSKSTRGIVTFELIVPDFDTLVDVQYTNAPNESLSQGTIRQLAVGQNPGVFGDGTHVYGGAPTPGQPGKVTWDISVITSLSDYTSNETFIDYFTNIFDGKDPMASFLFSVSFKRNNSVSMSVVIGAAQFRIAGCAAPPSPLSSPPPPSPPPTYALDEVVLFQTNTVSVAGLKPGEFVELWFELREGSSRLASRRKLLSTAPVDWEQRAPGSWATLYVNGEKTLYPVNITNGDEWFVVIDAADTFSTRRALVAIYAEEEILFDVVTGPIPNPPSPPSPPLNPPPPSPPDVATAGRQDARGWPWAIPIGMSMTIFVSFGMTLFAPIL